MPRFLFDLDGTITRKEILPVLAAELGLHRELAEVTRLTIEGAIPFTESLRMRVDILKSIPVRRVREIIATIPLHAELVDFIQARRAECCIVTGNLDVWIADLQASLGVETFCSRARIRDGEVDGLDFILDKTAVAAGVPEFRVAVGEGHADAGMIEASEVGIAFGAVHLPAASVMEVASHAFFSETSLCRFLRRL